MSGRKLPDECGLSWCDEADDHPGPHRRNLYDTFGLDVQTGRATILQLWLQGESARVKACVLVTGSCETGLTWPQASQLGWLMYDQARMNG